MAMGVTSPSTGGAVLKPTYGRGNMYRQPAPSQAPLAASGAGEPPGKPPHPYVSGPQPPILRCQKPIQGPSPRAARS